MSLPLIRISCAHVVPLLAVAAVATVTPLRGSLAVGALIALMAASQVVLLRGRVRADRRARFDPLTGLPGRSVLLDRLRRASDVGVIFVDLDRFKSVNDTYGHVVGDRVLVEVAHRLEQAAGRTATVVRYGGDEFSILVPASVTTAMAAAIERALAGPFESAPGLRLSASIGAAISASRGPEVITDADAAMYRAKRRRYSDMRPGYRDGERLGLTSDGSCGNLRSVRSSTLVLGRRVG